MISTKLLTSCSKQFVGNLGQAVRTQLVDGLLADLLQDKCFSGSDTSSWKVLIVGEIMLFSDPSFSGVQARTTTTN
jgi:hypothetical protein